VVVYATMETFSSVERQASVVRNIQRLEQIASVLTSLQRVADVDGHMSLPMPEIENGKPVIPSWISVERRT
ncbi:hypothetical protein, partial [Klebsiella pneumoniae]|uniref:hypothetical protein n=1 Tax=Klebsiella pneumoniae TaxID=573 RepID=UPI0013D637D0